MLVNGISFKEAERLINSREPKETALTHAKIMKTWTQDMRNRAFFSARCTNAAVLSQLKTLAERVTAGAMTQKQAVRLAREVFAREANALAAMGFAPKEGAQGITELASIPRLNLIFYTQLKMAQEKGHFEQWEQVADKFPYGIWRCGYSKEHRPEHLARNGKVYAFEHPIWRQSPPGGEFNCHCFREVITEAQLQQMGLTPEPMGIFFSPSSLGFNPSLPYDDKNGINIGGNIPPELIPPPAPEPEPVAPVAPVAQVPPPAPEPVQPEPEPPQPQEPEENAAHRQWRIARDEYRAANNNAVTDALANVRNRAERERLRPRLQEIADNITDMYTEEAARLGRPPKLVLNGESLRYSKNDTFFEPRDKHIQINYTNEWNYMKSTIRHEFEHWAHDRWFEQFAPNDFENTIKQAAEQDWQALQNKFAGKMKDLKRGNVAQTMAQEMFGQDWKNLTLSQRDAALGLADAIGEFSLGKYGAGHDVDYYRNMHNMGRANLFCETLANIPGIIAEKGLDYAKSVLPNMYRIFEQIGIL